MKVTNWRRKLAASLAACGLLSPAAALAAELNTNLVLDPSFENVNTADIGPFASSRLLQWNDAGVDGVADDDNFAYAYTQNYAGVNTPAGAGTHLFQRRFQYDGRPGDHCSECERGDRSDGRPHFGRRGGL